MASRTVVALYLCTVTIQLDMSRDFKFEPQMEQQDSYPGDEQNENLDKRKPHPDCQLVKSPLDHGIIFSRMLCNKLIIGLRVWLSLGEALVTRLHGK